MATPPAVVPAALGAMVHAGVAPPSRIVLDKPFGLSRASAQALNAQAREMMDERHLFRVDHFLYHHVVQELVRWRVQSDPLCLVDLLPAEHVEIIWDETRTAPSDRDPYPGAMRDMVQSHLLQLVAVVTMDSPEAMTRADLAEKRLAALRRISAAAAIDSSLARARHVRDSPTTLRTSSPSEPETFVTLELRSRAPRWHDVPFFLRAAKGVEQSRRQIALRFARRPPGGETSYVRLEVLAARVVVGRSGKDASAVEFSLPSDPESPSARLLRAALAGDDTFTLHPEEPEESWRIVEPLLEVWDQSDALLPTYPVGARVADILKGGTELRGA
jgi:glucose-6-phosphate 1-dehydrogenase